MKEVYQDRAGNCWQAAIASLLELELNEVPDFVSFEDSFKAHDDFLKTVGYKYIKTINNPRRLGYCGDMVSFANELKSYDGVNGLFIAMVYSPIVYNPNLSLEANYNAQHAILIDNNFKRIHDPNPMVKDVKYFDYPLWDVIYCGGVLSVDIIEKINHDS